MAATEFTYTLLAGGARDVIGTFGGTWASADTPDEFFRQLCERHGYLEVSGWSLTDDGQFITDLSQFRPERKCHCFFQLSKSKFRVSCAGGTTGSRWHQVAVVRLMKVREIAVSMHIGNYTGATIDGRQIPLNACLSDFVRKPFAEIVFSLERCFECVKLTGDGVDRERADSSFDPRRMGPSIADSLALFVRNIERIHTVRTLKGDGTMLNTPDELRPNETVFYCMVFAQDVSPHKMVRDPCFVRDPMWPQQ
jgi:hypothetical protein